MGFPTKQLHATSQNTHNSPGSFTSRGQLQVCHVRRLFTLAEVETKESVRKGSCCFCFIVSKCNTFRGLTRLFHGTRGYLLKSMSGCETLEETLCVFLCQSWHQVAHVSSTRCRSNIPSPVTHKNYREHKRGVGTARESNVWTSGITRDLKTRGSLETRRRKRRNKCKSVD